MVRFAELIGQIQPEDQAFALIMDINPLNRGKVSVHTVFEQESVVMRVCRRNKTI